MPSLILELTDKTDKKEWSKPTSGLTIFPFFYNIRRDQYI